MGTTRTLAADESFVEGRSRETAAALVGAAADLGRKGSVRTTYDGYIAPTEVVDAAGLGAGPRESAPEKPAEQSTGTEVPGEGEADGSAGEGTGPGEAEDTKEEDNGDDVAAFDPSTATVDQVAEYLAGADAEERERVLAAEAEGKNRKGVLDLAPTEEGK
jgi:hypothetical protein